MLLYWDSVKGRAVARPLLCLELSGLETVTILDSCSRLRGRAIFAVLPFLIECFFSLQQTITKDRSSHHQIE